MSDHTQVIAPPTAPAAAPIVIDAPVEQVSAPVPSEKGPGRVAGLLGGVNVSAGVWVGLGVAALGFLAIFFSWIKVAATLEVGRQMPYVVSGAMLGLGLIVVGIALVDMAVRAQDRAERRHQMALMTHVLEELREVATLDETGADQQA